MVIRKHARYSASWMVTVIHNGVEYTGTVRNMSLKAVPSSAVSRLLRECTYASGRTPLTWVGRSILKGRLSGGLGLT